MRTVTEVINLKQDNIKDQSKIMRKQDAIIEEMKRYIDNKEDFKNSLVKI